MNLLLDECIDWRLSRDLASHDVKSARQMGWSALKNGELLKVASEHFDVFVTTDRNLAFQQNIVAFDIAIAVLRAKSNRLADLRPLAPQLLVAIETLKPGTVTHVGPL